MNEDEDIGSQLEQQRQTEKNEIRQMFFNNITAFLLLQFIRSDPEAERIVKYALSKIKEGLERVNDERQDRLQTLKEFDPVYAQMAQLVPQLSPEGKNAAFYENLHDVVREWNKLISLDEDFN